MTPFADTTLIVLGAGLSTRFGSDKLASDFRGRPLATHLLAVVAPLAFAQKVLVARAQGWTRQFADAGFDVVTNMAPERGQSWSLQLALSHAKADNVLIMLADMPFVSAGHLQSIAMAFSASPGRAVASLSSGRRSPPAMFALSTLRRVTFEGDQGARTLLADAIAVMAEPTELADIDHPTDLLER